MLNAATQLDDLNAFPGTRLEALKGSRKGEYSTRVNKQYRIVFKFRNGAAFDVAVEDYH